MKRILRILPTLAVATSALSTARSAYARELCPPGPFANLCNLKLENDSGQIIGTIITIFIIIAILTSLFFIIFGAFRYTTSAGDQGKTQQARSTIIAAVVGLIIALSTFFIVNIIMYVFTGKALGGLEIPKLVN
jgi:heme/copper-type cytochrome/quinol oxidase subunit 2